MSIIILMFGNSSNEDEEEELPGEDWMYDKDVNSGLY